MNGRDLAQAQRLERGMIGLRWLVVGVGVLVTVFELRDNEPASPGYALPLGLLLVAGLALGNILISAQTDRAERVEEVESIGIIAFLLDIVATLGLVWISSANADNPVWVIAYILPLEGAIRYGVPGALAPVGVTLVSESLRELYLTTLFPHHAFMTTALAFRVGIDLAVAVVAGLMARSLEREAEKARERASVAEEAAHLAEIAAAREGQARREVSAFHTAILAGVAAEEVDESLQSMAEAVGRELRCDAFAVLVLARGDLQEPVLVAKGVHGDPGYGRDARLAPDSRLARVASTGRPSLHDDPYEAIVPLRVGGELIGVLHERAHSPLDRERLLLLGRLADQIALVAQAARLRSRQEETLRRLQELDDMKSDFVAITSHELRTPLAAIRGFVNTLRRRMNELSPVEVHEFLGIIDLQTDRLIRLVEDLLVVSRIEAGKLAFHPEEIEVSAFLDHLVAGLGEVAAGRVKRNDEPGLPGAITVDAQRLGQVITNLLQNALKFAPPDTPVSVGAARAGDDLIAISVEDRGPGIPRTELLRIFERFHQTEAASTRHAEGAGLGLYITKQLVEAMGGAITVSSDVGRGSTFVVTLPVNPVLQARVPPYVAAPTD